MSWRAKELAKSRSKSQQPYWADVEFSGFRKWIGFRLYLRPEAVTLPPEMLGETIDDCLVDFICSTLMRLKAGRYSAEHFKLVMDGV